MNTDQWKQELRAAIKFGMDDQLADPYLQNIVDYKEDFCMDGNWVEDVEGKTLL